ncbi:fam-m protein [Plasmodium brasilianum]|uniref:Fam-m protein n=1 Tax=Plasmodium brasilianum TaxID=5824 RepID=A0ACB9YGZ0_PLABR|nr:fam-m protein [Plasmodium brasilianum]
MEQNVKLTIAIKIASFILLTRICHFYNDVDIFNNSLCNNCNIFGKLRPRDYRLLVKNKENKDSYILSLKDNMQNNEEGKKEKSKKSKRNSLNKVQYYTEIMDYDNGIFDGKHFHFEKKWIKKKNYDYFIENNRRIRDISLKKVKFKSYGFGVTLLFLFFLLGLGYPILHHYNLLESVGGKLLSFLSTFNENINTAINASGMCIILFSIIMIILSVILIIALPKILINNEKYEKIKLMNE